MAGLVRTMEHAADESDRGRAFLDALESMGKGTLKRDDFLRKLAEAATKSLSLPVGKALVRAAVKAADKYVYDTLAPFGEAGHVLRIVLRIAKRRAPTDRVALLE